MTWPRELNPKPSAPEAVAHYSHGSGYDNDERVFCSKTKTERDREMKIGTNDLYIPVQVGYRLLNIYVGS